MPTEFISVKPVIVADTPDAHQVWLDVGCQHFTIGEYLETKDEAEWFARQLETAIVALSAGSGDWQPISTPPKENWLCFVCWLEDGEERFDFDFYEDDCWTNHANNYEHYMAVGGSSAGGPDCICIGPSEDPPYKFWMYASGPTSLSSEGEG